MMFVNSGITVISTTGRLISWSENDLEIISFSKFSNSLNVLKSFFSVLHFYCTDVICNMCNLLSIHA